MECPRCDGQGDVCRARINANGVEVWLCAECDALWLSPSEVSKANFVDFSSFVEPLGLKGLWSEITILEPDPGREAGG